MQGELIELDEAVRALVYFEPWLHQLIIEHCYLSAIQIDKVLPVFVDSIEIKQVKLLLGNYLILNQFLESFNLERVLKILPDLLLIF